MIILAMIGIWQIILILIAITLFSLFFYLMINNRKHPLYQIVLPIIIITIIIVSVISSDTVCQDLYKREKQSNYSGVITKKYIDEAQHNFQVIEILISSHKETYTMNYDKSGLFEYVVVGDSITKKKNSYEVVIHRDNKLVKTFTIDFKCDD